MRRIVATIHPMESPTNDVTPDKERTMEMSSVAISSDIASNGVVSRGTASSDGAWRGRPSDEASPPPIPFDAVKTGGTVESGTIESGTMGAGSVDTGAVEDRASSNLCSETFVSIPSAHFHLWIESFPTYSQVTGFAANSQIDRGVWNRFQRLLRRELPSMPRLPDRSAHVGQTFGLGLILVWFSLIAFLTDPATSIQSLGEFLRVWFTV